LITKGTLNFTFDLVKIEDLLEMKLDHDIDKNHLIKFYIIFSIYEGQG